MVCAGCGASLDARYRKARCLPCRDALAATAGVNLAKKRDKHRAAMRRYQQARRDDPAFKAAQADAQRRYLGKVATDPVALAKLREQRRAAVARHRDKKALEAMLA